MGTYLGIPEDISGSKFYLFVFLKDKLDHRINGWSRRWLGKGGKEILIKTIALALPTYVMSTVLLPLEICDKLVVSLHAFGGVRIHQNEECMGQGGKIVQSESKRGNGI